MGKCFRYELQGLPLHLVQVGPGELKKRGNQVSQVTLADSGHLGGLLPGVVQWKGVRQTQRPSGRLARSLKYTFQPVGRIIHSEVDPCSSR